MRPIRFLSGVFVGAALLVLTGTSASASDGYCNEYGAFVCCCTNSDCKCIQVRELVPAG